MKMTEKQIQTCQLLKLRCEDDKDLVKRSEKKTNRYAFYEIQKIIGLMALKNPSQHSTKYS